MKLNLGRDSEARFGQDFDFNFGRDFDVAFISCIGKLNSTLGSVVPLAIFYNSRSPT